ncbi:ABC transporter ATP-binding protein [Oceanobacillus sp. J11TS1]|uniref:ABC transporter ATP-binding protein n=1 Tax=Oceanobacillus sp. J11TS1 TaxID=2807191 RepID=UPI001B05538B|nr:ABC transporter ATP-binding protein [Oceanobacillus sp. J11TS1]GIO24985.1 ABC transporter ATP-binding protein [Oceanobacillus sp. J11TS1]
MNEEKILTVKDLTKLYKTEGGDVKALNNISFDLNKGELLAVMGTSGSGKSTLLNVLGAMDQPTSGEIILNGVIEESMFKEPKATIYRRENVGFVFQSFNLLKDLSVEENISMPLLLRGDGAEKIEAETGKMLDITGLTKWRKHRPVELSGGQQQRVAIGRALITSPPIVLADEPTGNLDFNTSTDILKTILKMKAQYNQSIIIVTHDPSVASYADRVLFFHDGKIVSEFVCNKDGKDIDTILFEFRLILSGERI